MRSILSGLLLASACAMLSVTNGYAQTSPTAALSDICDGDCAPEKFTACGDAFLEGPAFDEGDNLWLVSMRLGDIHKVTPSGECSIVANTGGEPQSLKYTGGNRLLGVDRKIGVFEIDTQTNEITRITNNYYTRNFAGLNDLVLDKDGGAYFTDAYGSSILNPVGAVYYIPPDAKKGVRVTKVLEGYAFPNGVVLSPDGKQMFVSESSAKRITVASIVDPGVASPELIRIFAAPQAGTGPDGMLVDRDGNLYAANYNGGQVTIYNRGGVELGAIKLPEEAGRGTTNVALHKGYLYITEGIKGEVWRVKAKIPGL